jgi:hypothetical protein
MALIKAQHTWMEWLDGNASMVRVFSFDFRKAFDTAPQEILCNKLKKLPISPRWSVVMHFAPGSAGFVFSSGVGVNAKWRCFTL